ncbi:hypothetical protein CSTERLE_06440 [Thermoclostridium stercorarium subsp. leptospartum DSM 9219]|uniref:Uncharacterized protein n=1 Tax=Thermoclostridium stercorarium subsp. leptospartum DSM 9219 TaxID=1346611 RepID=A0A1B1YKD9_THEST|nr:hypothetical protein [Thermoclostridium stercorarium]ANX01231.1 hypothetical protein CSTERLE_06440 [Thermoclostridium stercorarium subsp. leptospartum DSM 9219]
MKITDMAVLFVSIALSFALMLRIKNDNLKNAEYKSMILNRYLDTAVEDASNAMIVRGMDNKIFISREKAVEAFFTTLYVNFGIMHDEMAKDVLKAYIPVIVLIDYDGYWVYSAESYKNINGEIIQEMVWKPKKPYFHEKKGFVYLFTLDDYVKVFDTINKVFYEGRREELTSALPFDTLICDFDLFEEVRKRTIAESIKKDVNIAINKHNKYAKTYGIAYHFSPPSISDGNWQRNIEDIGILAFFQGIPVGIRGERFNSYALGAARIIRKNYYFIQQDINGIYYYHRENCPIITEKDTIYDNRRECALLGAFPCHICNP